jgi:Bacterial Ig domain/Secretion system C-terminal sorting domain
MTRITFSILLSYVMALTFVNQMYAEDGGIGSHAKTASGKFFKGKNSAAPMGNNALLVPVANNDNAVAVQNNLVTISSLANDELNGTFQALTIISQPTNGVVSISGNNFIYTPNGGFNGTNTFSYSFTTIGGTSNIATVTVTVLPLFAPLTANNDFATTSQNQPVQIFVLANDGTSGSGNNLSIALQAANGTVTVSGTAGTSGSYFIYTPNPGFVGTDIFRYYFFTVGAYGIIQSSSTATVSVTVLAQPIVSPIANNDFFAARQVGQLTVSPTTNDVIVGTVQSVTLQSQPANGTVVVSGNDFIYTPATGFFGITSFTYFYTTTSGISNTATITVSLANAYPAPVANNDSISSPKNTAATIFPTTNDVLNGVSIRSVTVLSQPANGTAIPSGSNIIYTPATDFTGTNTFTYQLVVDGRTSNTATVTVTVTNATPVSVTYDDIETTYQNTPVTISVLDNDVIKGIYQSLTVNSQPANGVATVSGNKIIYTPNTGFRGNNSFTYILTTTNGNSNASTVKVKVLPPLPIANNDIVSTVVNKQVIFNPLANDVINGKLSSVKISSQPANGSANFSGNKIVYIPNAGFVGTNTFTYFFSTSNGISNIATVTVTVNGIAARIANLPPSTIVNTTNEAVTEKNAGFNTVTDTAKNILKEGNNNASAIRKINNTSAKAVLIYPNPANVSFVVNLKDYAGKDVEVRLYNQVGLELFVHRFKNVNASTTDHIEVSQYTNGQYFIRLTTKDGVDVVKPVIILK